MPAGSSKKRERQYEHIKDSYEDRGVSAKEAEERAARTVNKQRREHGETKGSRKKS
jgi:plasmid stabilization system protein ParE